MPFAVLYQHITTLMHLNKYAVCYCPLFVTDSTSEILIPRSQHCHIGTQSKVKKKQGQELGNRINPQVYVSE